MTTSINGRIQPRSRGASRIGRRQLQTIADGLDQIDRELLTLLRAHRYATTRQLAQMIERDNRYASARSALRQTSRRLNRHHQLGLVNHLERRIGGVRAGSSGYIWHLTEAGWRLAEQQPIRMIDTEDASVALDDDAITATQQRRHRHTEPSHAFLAHILAITEARVIIQRAVQDTGGDLALVRTEPACWRSWTTPGGGLAWLKPDLETITQTADGAEDHWLLEIDLGTENPARLITKCHDYQAHFNTGIHQTRFGYYPQVVWVMNEQRRAEWLRQHIADDPRLTTALFKVIGSEEELATIIQAGPQGEYCDPCVNLVDMI